MKSIIRAIVKSCPPLYRFYNRRRGYRLHEAEVNIAYELLGSSYGAWALPRGFISPTSVVYTFGVGEDISFDLALIEKVGCDVHAFDPTPIAVRWIARQKLTGKFKFQSIGIAERDGVVAFAVPEAVGSHSYSRQSDTVGDVVKCPVRKLATIMASLGHQQVDLLKMDIEGFEYAVLSDMIASKVFPRFLLVEFHHKSFGYGPTETNEAVALLRVAGYKIFWVSELGREYGFRRAVD